MRSLAERHEDRAKRKAMNATERNFVPVPSVATVETMMRDALALRARLPEEQRTELDESLKAAEANGEFAFSGPSLAEAPDGSGDTMAGIGVVNARVVPAQVLAGNDAWGETQPVTQAPLPPAELSGAENAAGQALVDQGLAGGGWGAQGGGEGNGAGSGTEGQSSGDDAAQGPENPPKSAAKATKGK